jgi:hypothetical protein
MRKSSLHGVIRESLSHSGEGETLSNAEKREVYSSTKPEGKSHP